MFLDCASSSISVHLQKHLSFFSLGFLGDTFLMVLRVRLAYSKSRGGFFSNGAQDPLWFDLELRQPNTKGC